MEMKKAFVLLWHGITGIFSGIADWFTVILGMRDDSKYGRFLRRVVGSCFALIMLFVTSAACVGFFEAIKKHLDDERLCFDDTSEYAQYLSRGITYYDGVYGKDGYVKDSNGEKTVALPISRQDNISELLVELNWVFLSLLPKMGEWWNNNLIQPIFLKNQCFLGK